MFVHRVVVVSPSVGLSEEVIASVVEPTITGEGDKSVPTVLSPLAPPPVWGQLEDAYPCVSFFRPPTRVETWSDAEWWWLSRCELVCNKVSIAEAVIVPGAMSVRDRLGFFWLADDTGAARESLGTPGVLQVFSPLLKYEAFSGRKYDMELELRMCETNEELNSWGIIQLQWCRLNDARKRWGYAAVPMEHFIDKCVEKLLVDEVRVASAARAVACRTGINCWNDLKCAKRCFRGGGRALNVVKYAVALNAKLAAVGSLNCFERILWELITPAAPVMRTQRRRQRRRVNHSRNRRRRRRAAAGGGGVLPQSHQPIAPGPTMPSAVIFPHVVSSSFQFFVRGL